MGNTPSGQINKNAGRKGINYNALMAKEAAPSKSFQPPSVKGTGSTGLGRTNKKLQ